MVSETNLEQFREVSPAGRFTLQNSAMLKIRLENDQVQAKLGSMVAYQGDVRFEYQSGGLGRFFKKAVTGEGVKLMTAVGSGDLFLAQDKRKVMVLELENERMTVNGENKRRRKDQRTLGRFVQDLHRAWLRGDLPDRLPRSRLGSDPTVRRPDGTRALPRRRGRRGRHRLALRRRLTYPTTRLTSRPGT